MSLLGDNCLQAETNRIWNGYCAEFGSFDLRIDTCAQLELSGRLLKLPLLVAEVICGLLKHSCRPLKLPLPMVAGTFTLRFDPCGLAVDTSRLEIGVSHLEIAPALLEISLCELENRLLAFSSKNRGFYPSCCGRRMADTAAHLVDRVIPPVPVRQWVLSLPYKLRFRAAFDFELMGELLGIFVREVFASLRRRAQDILQHLFNTSLVIIKFNGRHRSPKFLY